MDTSWIDERGLRGPLKRVVVVYPAKRADDAWCLGTVNGTDWYPLPLIADPRPGDMFDGVPKQKPGSRTMPIAMTWRWFATQGRVEEVTP